MNSFYNYCDGKFLFKIIQNLNKIFTLEEFFTHSCIAFSFYNPKRYDEKESKKESLIQTFKKYFMKI